VLGVDVGASSEEIAAAYRSLAARYHPDVHAGAPPAELARLQRRMAMINEAYAALRSAPPPPSAGAPVEPSPSPTPYPKPPVPARPPASYARDRPRRRKWPYVLLALAIFGATVGVVAAATARTPAKGVPTTWGVGSCVQGADEPAPVRCDGPHDGRIVDVGSTPDDCPTTTDAVVADGGYIWCIDMDA